MQSATAEIFLRREQGESFGSGLSADRLALLDRAFQLRRVRRGVRGMTYDLKIVGGSIVDGTGRERFRGDIGVKDGRIVAIGEMSGKGEQTVDAGGLIVAPGFVDIHTHYDAPDHVGPDA